MGVIRMTTLVLVMSLRRISLLSEAGDADVDVAKVKAGVLLKARALAEVVDKAWVAAVDEVVV